MKKRGVWGLFEEAASLWSAHNAPRLGAALAYYAVLSLAPLLILAVAVCGMVFGEDAVRGQVYWEIKDIFGPQGADVIQNLLKAAHKPGSGIFATIAGIVVLLFGASGVFAELRDTLNLIWDAPPASMSLSEIVRYRVFSFAMVSATGLLLMASLIMSTVVQSGLLTALRLEPRTIPSHGRRPDVAKCSFQAGESESTTGSRFTSSAGRSCVR